MQLGLSRNHRHMHLWSKFGQLQLSKVRSNQNLATCLTNNSAQLLAWIGCSLSLRCMLRLPMRELCLLCDAMRQLLLASSPGSFLVGMVSKTPAMEQLLRTDCSLELSDHELSGKELVANFADPKPSEEELAENLAYQQLLGKETEKDSLDILGNQSLRRRTSSLEKKNFCFRVIQLLCLAFCSALGPMIFDHHSFQQRELAAAYPYKIQSLHQEELVAAYGEQIKSLQQTGLEASYSEGQTRASQLQLESSQKELVEHLAQLSHKESAIQSFQLQSFFQNELSRSAFTADQELQQRELEAAYALTEQISLLASVPERELTADGACKSLRFSPTRACFQLSEKGLADKSFELTTAQLCHQHSAERAYSSRSLHQLTLSMAQFNSQLQLQTGQLCRTDADRHQLRAFNCAALLQGSTSNRLNQSLSAYNCSALLQQDSLDQADANHSFSSNSFG